MSTYYGYVCLDHVPELFSETWGRDREELRKFYKAFRAGGYQYGDYGLPLVASFSPPGGPSEFLVQHPNCNIAIGSEYGVVEEIL